MRREDLDLAWFTARHACSDQVAQLRAKFGEAPIPITAATLRWAGRQNLSLAWWASRWLSGPLRAEYARQMAPLRAEYAWQMVPLQAEYKRQEAEVLIGVLGLR